MVDQEAEVRNVTWPQVVLTLGIVTLLLMTVVSLAIMKLNVTEVLAAVVLSMTTLLGLLGWQKTNTVEQKIDQVKEISNGRLSDAIEAQKRLQEEYKALSRQYAELALRVPVPPETTPSTTPDQVAEVGDR